MCTSSQASRSRAPLLAAACLVAGLAAPAPAAAARYFSPCCYTGAVTESDLASLSLVLADGSSRRLTDAFPGLLDADGGGQPFSTQRWRYGGKTGRLAAAAGAYDANDDAFLDHQELLVLVLVESARGVGVDATGLLAAGAEVRALALPGPEIRQLSGWLKRNEGRLSDEALSLLMDVDELRLRMRRSSGASGGR